MPKHKQETEKKTNKKNEKKKTENSLPSLFIYCTQEKYLIYNFDETVY